MPGSIEALIDRQLRRWEHDRRNVRAGRASAEHFTPTEPIITVSRHHGSHGCEVAAKLAERFGYTLLHRDLIDRIAESTGLTRRLLETLDEHSRSQITSWIDSMLWGKYLDEGDYAVGLLTTVRSIARLGGVVVVGRGANFIVGLEGGFHLRVVAPRVERIRNLMARKSLSEANATHEIETVDQERGKFIRKLFHASVDDPLAYDVVVNETGRSVETVVEIVTVAAEEKIERLKEAHAHAPHPATAG
jgi:cytidylate kinase